MSDYGKQLSRIIDVQQKLKEAETKASNLIDEVSRLRNLLRFIGRVVNKDRSVKFLYHNNKVPFVVVPVSLTCEKEGLTLRAYDLHRMVYGHYQLQFITPVFSEDE